MFYHPTFITFGGGGGAAELSKTWIRVNDISIVVAVSDNVPGEILLGMDLGGIIDEIWDIAKRKQKEEKP